MFFTEWGTAPPKLERALLDGTERTDIVNKNIVYPYGVAVDHPNRLVKLSVMFARLVDGLRAVIFILSDTPRVGQTNTFYGSIVVDTSKLALAVLSKPRNSTNDFIIEYIQQIYLI